MKFLWRIAAASLAAFLLSPQQGISQSMSVVEWSAVLKPSDPQATDDKEGLLELSATVQKGWHVYAATQSPGGPTPLRVMLEDGAAARLTGIASGTVPEKRHDTSFDLDTEFYTQAFTLHWPLAWRTARAGAGSLPVAVRYQTCSDRECQPPKTIHLSVSTAGAVQK